MTFVEGLVEREFIEYVAKSLGLDPQERPQPNKWLRLGNTIGALALRMNLMSDTELNEILEVQDVQGGYFGEIAVEKGFLTSAQVRRLLEIQNLHDQLYLAEKWVIEGKLDVPSLINRLAMFLSRRGGEGERKPATSYARLS